MATGDYNDLQARLFGQLPPSWFKDASGTPVLDTVLAGKAYPLTWIYTLYQYVLTQSRLATMTGVWLDRFSYDFFGETLLRRSGELDTQYRQRISNELLRERQTRKAIITALTNLTGNAPQLLEMWNPQDCGSYDTGACAFDTAGAYGDLSFHNQIFITAFRPAGGGIPLVGGYVGDPVIYKPRLLELALLAGGFWGMVPVQETPWPGGGGAYAGNETSTLELALMVSGMFGMMPISPYGALEYTDAGSLQVGAEDAEIYATVKNTIAAGTTGWTAIQSKTVSGKPQFYFGNVANTQDVALALSFF